MGGGVWAHGGVAEPEDELAQIADVFVDGAGAAVFVVEVGGVLAQDVRGKLSLCHMNRSFVK